MLAGIPPTPELLAKVAALPPANDEPGVDQAFSRAADPHFTLRRLLRPFAIALIAGLILDGLDAIASIALPWLMRGGIDHGIEAKTFRVIILISMAALAIVWPTGSSTPSRPSSSAATASGCSTRSGSRSSPSSSGSAWTSTSARWPAGS